MVSSTILGFPRMGENRELKKIVESYWAGKVDQSTLIQESSKLRELHWQLQASRGIESIPSNDFSFYDQVLDHSLMFGVVPTRYDSVVQSEPSKTPSLRTYFAMARGLQTTITASPHDHSATDSATAHTCCNDQPTSIDVCSCEMRKWFDTNYHYIVPEFQPTQQFGLAESPKILTEYLEARAIGIETKPVLIGPISYLMLGKSSVVDQPYKSLLDAPTAHLDQLLALYVKLFTLLGSHGVKSIQLDEPYLCFDYSAQELQVLAPLYTRAFNAIHHACPSIAIHLTTYFGDIGIDNLALITPSINNITSIHLDFTRSLNPINIINHLFKLNSNLLISIGIVDGRNIWKSNYKVCLEKIKQVVDLVGQDKVIISSSCSLLHSPHTLEKEVGKIKPVQVLEWLSFATEKLSEITFLTKVVRDGLTVATQAEYDANVASCERRAVSPIIHNQAVQQRVAAVTPDMYNRTSVFERRLLAQRQRLGDLLPALFPTTTIGSFPQTTKIRQMRNHMRSGAVSAADYDTFIRQEIADVIALQNEVGLDILVHGEPERNDMVEFFGEQLAGFTFTSNGWVQSFGSRCVKPPVIYGDVSRPHAMTVELARYAQSLTPKPVKGMLTGPVTILQWSFVRDDIPRSQTCTQIALAVRDEVVDLASESATGANLAIIQIDEPAIREGLPLRRQQWVDHLAWSVGCFKLATTGVADNVQIHTHMCYSDFNDIFISLQDMDADVLTIENSKSDAKLLSAFSQKGYTNAIGPGLYDIHSPRVASIDEMVIRIEQMLKYLQRDLIWANPDCGLKTRALFETKATLLNLVNAAKLLRSKYNN